MTFGDHRDDYVHDCRDGVNGDDVYGVDIGADES